MKKPTNLLRLLWLLFVMASALSLPARAARLTVDDDGKEFPAAQFPSIHAALEAASSGDEIVVYPGHYYAPVHIGGKDVYLHSIDSADSGLVRQTIIDGQILDSAVIFTGNETEACVLEGFTITHGYSLTNGGGILGGASKACRATLRFNLIENNQATEAGGGIANCSGLIINNTIRANTALYGGGLANCNAPGIQGNTIQANSALEGGGLYACNGPITKNIIAENTATNDGGGLKNCRGRIQGNAIRDNTAATGAGLIFCSGEITGNTLSANAASGDGGALHTCSGTVRGNTIQANQASNGAGLFNCDGAIQDNTLQSNAASKTGGGLCNCDGPISGNRFSGNTAKTSGGAIASSRNVTIRLNLFEGNQALEGAAIANGLALIENNRFLDNQAGRGGALIRCSGTIRNNLFAGNLAQDGSVIAESHGQYLQNTFAHNRLNDAGGAAIDLMEGCLFRNNLFYRNDGVLFALNDSTIDPDRIFLIRNDFHGQDVGIFRIDAATIIQTADELDQQLDGCRENRLADPLFMSPGGPDGQADTVADNDYHLAGGSPAIDRATIHALDLLPVNDLDGLGRWSGDAPDLGCFEFAHQPDTDGDGLSDAREAALGSDPALPDTDGDGLIDSMEIRRGTSPTVANMGPGLTTPDDYPTVQETVLMAFDGEQVTVRPGTYNETINVAAKSLHLTGQAPADSATVEATVIDATRQGPVLTLSGGQNSGMIIEGLTLRGGYAAAGSAILGQGAPATLRNCVIAGNIAESGGTVDDLDGPVAANCFENNSAYHGGALANCQGPVNGNVMRGNTVQDDGGAIFRCQGEILNNMIENNTAKSDGGAIAYGFGPVHNNTIRGNRAQRGGALFQCSAAISQNAIQTNEARDGGGLVQCHDIIRDNTILNNKAQEGGGLYQCHGEITGNTIYGNTATYNGGGLSSCRASIHNNTISHNQAYTGGGLVLCDAPIESNWIIANVAANNGGGLAAGGKRVKGNRFQGNQALNGGAIAYTDSAIQGNMIYDNTAANGGAIYHCDGLIDGNTVRGNSASLGGGGFSVSNGVIRNNLILGNLAQRGGAMDQCNGSVAWNTIVGNGNPAGGVCGGLSDCAATIGNNIIAFNHNQALALDDATTPPLVLGNCFFNNWDGLLLEPDGSRVFDSAAVEASHANFNRNIQADPRFVDLLGPDKNFVTFADADLRLRPDSPGIDRSVALDDELLTDFAGNPRPLDGNGDGQAIRDLGALEFFAVTILQPRAGDTLIAGQSVTIVWQTDRQWAGQALRFELWRDGRRVLVLGDDWNALGRDTVTFDLPPALTPGDDYRLLAISTWDASLVASAGPLSILAPGSNASSGWLLYE